MSALFVKCGQTWPVIPELCMWDSHGRTVKPVACLNDRWFVGG